ncbi:glycosyltransferase family 2 protein [Methylobacterium sp. A54F]
MRLAALTMVYNEAARLPRWLDHYGRHFGRDNLRVIDHGSRDGTRDLLDGVGVIPLARTVFDERARAAFVSDTAAALLDSHDGVVFTDVDEFLIPAAGGGLSAHLAARLTGDRPGTVTAIGFDVLHHLGTDGPLRPDRPLLRQRPHIAFAPYYCKPAATRVPVRWRPGFHFCDRPVAFGGLFLFHTRLADLDAGLARLAESRTIAMEEMRFGTHWRLADAEFRGEIEAARHHDYRPLTEGDVAYWQAEFLRRLAGEPPNAIARVEDLARIRHAHFRVPEHLLDAV